MIGFLIVIFFPSTAEPNGERILKIGQYLPNLWAMKYGDVFFYETWCIGMLYLHIAQYVIFFPRNTMRKHALCCRPVSVHLSVTLVDCIHTAEDIVIIFSRPGSPHHSSFLTPNAGTQLQRKPLQRGHKIHGVGKFCNF